MLCEVHFEPHINCLTSISDILGRETGFIATQCCPWSDGDEIWEYCS